MTPYRVPDPPPVPRRPRLRRHQRARLLDAQQMLMLVVTSVYVVALLVAHAGVYTWGLRFGATPDGYACLICPWVEALRGGDPRGSPVPADATER